MHKGATGGIGFFGILTIIFVVLKLTHNIDWSWVWVLAPLWLPFVFWIIFFVVLGSLFFRKK